MIGEPLHQFDSHEGKSWIGVLVDFQAELLSKPELRQKVRHGLDAVHGNAAEFDPGVGGSLRSSRRTRSMVSVS